MSRLGSCNARDGTLCWQWAAQNLVGKRGGALLKLPGHEHDGRLQEARPASTDEYWVAQHLFDSELGFKAASEIACYRALGSCRFWAQHGFYAGDQSRLQKCRPTHVGSGAPHPALPRRSIADVCTWSELVAMHLGADATADPTSLHLGVSRPPTQICTRDEGVPNLGRSILVSE